MMINPLRVLFLMIVFTAGYTIIPFEIIQQTGNYIYALIFNIIISIIIGIIFEINIADIEDCNEN